MGGPYVCLAAFLVVFSVAFPVAFLVVSLAAFPVAFSVASRVVFPVVFPVVFSVTFLVVSLAAFPVVLASAISFAFCSLPIRSACLFALSLAFLPFLFAISLRLLRFLVGFHTIFSSAFLSIWKVVTISAFHPHLPLPPSRLPVCLSVCLPVCLSVCLLSVCPFVRLRR